MFQPPVNREVTAQDFVDSWNYVTDPANQSLRVVHPRPGRGQRRRRLSGRHARRASPASRPSTTTRSRSSCAIRSPSSRRPSATPWPPRSPSTTSRRSAPRLLQTEAGRHRPVHGRAWKNNQSIDAGQEPELLGHEGQRAARTSTPSTCRSSRRRRRSGSSSRRAPSTTAACRPGQVARRRDQRQGQERRVDGQGVAEHLGIYFVGINMNKPTLGGDATCDLRKAITESPTRRTSSTSSTRASRSPRPATCRWASPAIAPDQSTRTRTTPRRRQGAVVAGIGTRPDAPLLVQHGRRPPEDRRGAAGRLAEGRHRRQAQQLRVGHVPRQAVQGQQGQRQPARSAWAGSPTTRRWTTSSTRCSSRRRRRTGSYTLLHQPAGRRPASSRPAPRPTPTQRYNLYAQAEKLILTDMPGRPAVLLPRLPRHQQPHRRLRPQPDGLHRHVEGLGQVSTRRGCVCSG